MNDHDGNSLLASTLILIIIVSTRGVFVHAVQIPEGLGNVHGTVVDEDGAPIPGVKVTAYLNSGSLESTEYTDSEGYFRLALGNSGQYTVYFEKEGYARQQRSINVPTGLYSYEGDDPVKMGDVVLEKNLVLSSSVLSRVVIPGETVGFPFIISIVGDEPEEIEFSVDSPEGWHTRVLDASSEVKMVLLGSGSMSLTLEVTVPETLDETETVSITAIGSLNATLVFTVLPSQAIQHDIEISTSYPSVSEEAGRTISFPLTISNMGEGDETLDLEALVPEGWTVSFITGGGMEILSLFLEAGDSEALTLDVEPFEEAIVGVYPVEIQAVSDGELLDSLELMVSLKEAEGEVELLSAYTDVTVEAGKVLEYPITIWNRGDDDDLFLITVLSAPAEWDTVFKSTDIEISSLLISAGSSATLDFEVTPPEGCEAGSYTLTVFVESESGDARDTLVLGVDLEEATSDVEIVSTFTDVTVEAGSTINYPLRIWNKGENDDQLTMKVVSAPNNWDVVFTLDGNRVSSFYIAAGDSLSLNLEADPPNNVQTGEYSIVIQSESEDGTLSEEMELKATVVGSYGVEVELSTLYTTITIGDSVEFTVEVTNDGFSPLTAVYLETTVPEEWEIAMTPSQVSTLDPRESASFTIVAETPSDTVAGDYMITVQALSDQAESEESDLRVTAKTSTSWGFIGIGLAGVAVIGLIVAFTRFKRR